MKRLVLKFGLLAAPVIALSSPLIASAQTEPDLSDRIAVHQQPLMHQNEDGDDNSASRTQETLETAEPASVSTIPGQPGTTPAPRATAIPLPSVPELPLSYEIRTLYRTPGGDIIERRTDALLVVPTPVDVDGDLNEESTPDLLAQLTIDAGRATVRVSLLPAAPSPMPLLIEAIVSDPRGTTDLRVAYGYDARMDTAPGTFQSTVQLLGAARITSFAMDVETAGAGAQLAIIGEVFEEGPTGERMDPQRGRILYEPVPVAAHVGLLQGSDLGIQQSGVDLTATAPSRVEVLIEDIQGSRVVRSDIVIDQAPNVLSLILTDSESGQRTWSYQASARVQQLDLTLRETRAQSIVDDFAILLADMAQQVLIVQETSTHARLEASSPIGSLSVGLAKGRAIEWLPRPAYLFSTNRGQGDSLAFRVLGLTRAELDTADPFIVDVTLAPGPFFVSIQDGARDLEAFIGDLPAHVRLEYSALNGTVEYTGSAPIDVLTVTVNDPDGVSGRATRLELELEDLPTRLSLAYGANSGEARMDAGSGQVGALRLLLTSGPEIQVDEGFDGIVQEDVPSHYALAVRLTGLKLVSVSTDGPPYAVQLNKTPGPFLVQLIDGDRSIRGEIHDLPDSMSAVIDPSGSLSYTASARIGEISIVASDPQGLVDRATDLDLLIEDLPSELTLDFSTENAARIDAHSSQIGAINLLLTSGPVLSLPDGYDGVIYEDVASHYALVARIHGLKLVDTSFAEPYALELRKDAGPFIVQLRQQATFAEVLVHDLPDYINASIDLDGVVEYTASAPISELIVNASDPEGIVDRATNFELRVQDLPSAITLQLPETGTASLTAGDRIGAINLSIHSGIPATIPADFDGVVLRDIESTYRLALRLTGLRLLSVTTQAPYELNIQKDAGAFLIDLEQDDTLAVIEIRDLPDSINATLDPEGNASYTASAPIGRLQVHLQDPDGLIDRATQLDLLVTDLPTSLDLSFGSLGEAGIDANGGQVGFIDLLATSGPVVSLPSGYDGVILEDETTHYALAARLTGLRVAKVTTESAPYTLTLEKQAGPFLIRLDQFVRHTQVEILDLPSSLTATLDPGGSLSYSASAPISNINVEMVDPAGIAGRATHAEATLQGMPPSLNVTWAANNGVVSATANGSVIGAIEVFLHTGSEQRPLGSWDGVVFEDLSDRYLMYLRLTELRSISFSQGPPPSLSIAMDGGEEFQASVKTQKPSGIAETFASISSLPSSVTIEFSSATNLRYRASSRVGQLVLLAFDPDGISGRAKWLNATITDLPTSLDAGWSSNGTINLNAATSYVGKIELLLTSGPANQLPAQYDGILLEDLADRYVVFARITGLKQIIGTQQPTPDITLNTLGGRPFKVELNELDGSKTEYTRATLTNLPTSVRVRVGDREMFYDASSTADSLVLDTNSGDRWNLHADIGNPLPSNMYLCAANNGFCNGFARSSGAGSFKFSASHHTSLNVFDCSRPLNSNCQRGSASEYTQLDNWRVRHFQFDADTSDSGFDGYTFNNTNGHALQGYLKRIGGSTGFEANIKPGYWSQNRHVRWDWWGLDKDKSGSVNCADSSFDIRVLGIWIGVTSYVC